MLKIHKNYGYRPGISAISNCCIPLKHQLSVQLLQLLLLSQLLCSCLIRMLLGCKDWQTGMDSREQIRIIWTVWWCYQARLLGGMVIKIQQPSTWPTGFSGTRQRHNLVGCWHVSHFKLQTSCIELLLVSVCIVLHWDTSLVSLH